jgi:hypothetical protein
MQLQETPDRVETEKEQALRILKHRGRDLGVASFKARPSEQ